MSMSITIPNQGVTKPLLIAHRQDGDGPNPNPKKLKQPSIKKFGAGGGAVKYMECLKNHAAAIGGSATDGCGEFMPGGEEGTLEALKCSACNCHRNFHRKIQMQQPPPPPQHGSGGVLRIYDLAAAAAADDLQGEGRKRFRTKFSQEQKEKMQRFAEKAGWKIQKADDAELRSFCEEIGVKRKVLKVWMHNNKYNFANATTHLTN